MAQVEKSRVTLRVGSGDLIPDEITKLLGTAPTYSMIKGQPKPHRKTGEPTKYLAKIGMWSLSAKDREPEDMDGQIQEILSQTTSDLKIWRKIAEKHEIDLFCGIFMAGTNEGMSLSPSSLTALGERGIELALDIYGGHERDEPETPENGHAPQQRAEAAVHNH